ncbi:MAG: hypothetical protein MUE46_18345 [Xanthomonadales bacterium]|jgi:hypothetical protein|nr:hypothetical protein [Xanthomonadales bacterium]
MLNFPFLLIPFLLVHGLMFFTPGGLEAVWLSTVLPSGSTWTLTAGDAAVLLGLACLYVEIAKSTRTRMTAVLDHVASLALFVVALLEFLLLPAAGNTAFLLITVMCLVDVIAGFTVGMAVARRDVGIMRE